MAGGTNRLALLLAMASAEVPGGLRIDLRYVPVVMVVLRYGPLWGALVAATTREEAFPEGAEEHLAYFAEIAGIAIGNAEANSRLAQLAMSDPLTGLANHRTFHSALAAEAERARRHGRPLALAVIDVDHFKAVNDLHGHMAGDRVLVEVSRRLRGAALAMLHEGSIAEGELHDVTLRADPSRTIRGRATEGEGTTARALAGALRPTPAIISPAARIWVSFITHPSLRPNRGQRGGIRLRARIVPEPACRLRFRGVGFSGVCGPARGGGAGAWADRAASRRTWAGRWRYSRCRDRAAWRC